MINFNFVFSKSRLYTSLTNCRQIIEETSSYLTTNVKNGATGSTSKEKIYSLDDMSILSETQTANFKPLIQFDTQQQQQAVQEKTITIFNSNLQANRNEIVSIRVNTPHVEIFDETTKTLLQNIQVSFVWPNTEGGALTLDNTNSRMDSASQLTHALDFAENSFEILFEVNVKPLSFSKYTIRTKQLTSDISEQKTNLTRVDFYQREANGDFVDKVKSDINTR